METQRTRLQNLTYSAELQHLAFEHILKKKIESHKYKPFDFGEKMRYMSQQEHEAFINRQILYKTK